MPKIRDLGIMSLTQGADEGNCHPGSPSCAYGSVLPPALTTNASGFADEAVAELRQQLDSLLDT